MVTTQMLCEVRNREEAIRLKKDTVAEEKLVLYKVVSFFYERLFIRYEDIQRGRK